VDELLKNQKPKEELKVPRIEVPKKERSIGMNPPSVASKGTSSSRKK